MISRLHFPTIIVHIISLAQVNYNLVLCNMHTIKPIDREAVIAAVKETGKVLVCEEHNVIGGLGDAVASVIAEEGLACKFRKHGMSSSWFASMTAVSAPVRYARIVSVTQPVSVAKAKTAPSASTR